MDAFRRLEMTAFLGQKAFCCRVVALPVLRSRQAMALVVEQQVLMRDAVGAHG